MATHSWNHEALNRKQGLELLRREVLDARVTVALDKALGRPTAGPVKRMADLELPSAIEIAEAEATSQTTDTGGSQMTHRGAA